MAVSEVVLGLIRKHAIKNAIDYGKADAGSVLGKVIRAAGGVPVPELRAGVARVVGEVNAMSEAELESAYRPFANEFASLANEKAERTSKPKLAIEGAAPGSVFTRYPPEPGGYMTLGNAKQCILSDELARAYGGRIFLYFDDTNPEKCRQEYVDGIKRDTAWLGVSFSKEYYASDHIEKEYDACRRLIGDGHAYICLCSPDLVKKNRFARVECEHRSQRPEQNLQLFGDMLAGKYEESEALARLKGDMASENTTLRDPAIFRVKKTPHYRQGGRYIVWPTYHINTPLIDSLNGVTDVLRGKEYEIFDESYRLVLRYLGLRQPRLHYQAMLQIKGGLTAHKRELRELISRGLLSGWDDPRLLTVMAMRRRGIRPEAVRAFIMRFGLSRTDSTVPIDMLFAENRKVIDQVAKHLFFVSDPVRVEVQGFVGAHASLRLHPNNDLGTRDFDTGSVFYISGSDSDAVEAGATMRLKDLIDIKVLSKSDGSTSAAQGGGGSGRIVQWVSAKNMAECSVLIPGPIFDDSGAFRPDSLDTVTGYVEGYAGDLAEHEPVQFERFGYCVLDGKDKGRLRFIFTSK